MAIGNHRGRARFRLHNVQPQAECDDCGIWYNRGDLSPQYQWAGPSLQRQGFLKCRTCLDKPQQQLRSIILPPDPEPVVDPRPSKDVQVDGNRVTDTSGNPVTDTGGGAVQQSYGPPTP